METKLTKEIKTALWGFTNAQGTFGCYEVTIGWFGSERVDYMTYDTKGDFRCYEIKISKSDFHSKNHNSFVGHFGYYVIPQELAEQLNGEMPDGIGLISYVGKGKLELIKRPKRRDPSVDCQILRDSMIRSLCRDVDYLYKMQNPDKLKNLKRDIRKLSKDIQKQKDWIRELRNENYYLRHPDRKPFDWEESECKVKSHTPATN